MLAGRLPADREQGKPDPETLPMLRPLTFGRPVLVCHGGGGHNGRRRPADDDAPLLEADAPVAPAHDPATGMYCTSKKQSALPAV